VVLFVQRVIDGLSNGSIYAALSLAVVLVWRSTGTLNLAQGPMGMVCAFIAWKLEASAGAPAVVGVLVATIAGALLGAVIEVSAIRPLERQRSHLPVIIVTLGIGLAIEAIAGKVFTLNSVAISSLFPFGGFSVAGVQISWNTVGLIGTIGVVALLLWALFSRTTVGLHMRAAVDNPDSAQLSGIRRGRMLMLGWALAGGLGALAACLIAPVTEVQTTMLDGVLLYAFAAAILGGLDSPAGAVIGAFVIGVFQALVSSYVSVIGNDMSLLAVLVIIVITLIVRPRGIFGRAEVARV
jgi:branched-chain amino acid transport system permease protein